MTASQSVRSASSAARRRAILDAAAECYHAGGLEAVTIEAVAARSGASVGSIYHHFGNKNAVLRGLFLAALEPYRQEMQTVLGRARSAEDLVKGPVRHYLQWVAANPHQARLINTIRHALRDTPEDTELKADRHAFYAPLKELFASGVSQGQVRDLPFPLVVVIIMGPANELARQWLREPGEEDLAQYADVLADAAWRSVAR